MAVENDATIQAPSAGPPPNGIAKKAQSSANNGDSPYVNGDRHDHETQFSDASAHACTQNHSTSSSDLKANGHLHLMNGLANEYDYGVKDNGTNRAYSQPPSQTPVLIIGGGPVGLLASILLGKAGIRSTVLERHARRLGQPKAHAINPRSLEILRQAGLDTRLLRKLGASPTEADVVRFVLSVSGLEIGTLPYERQDDGVKRLTAEPLFNIPQPLLEEYLWKTALETGMISIWREWQWQESVEFGDRTIVSKVLDRQTNNEIYITSKYLLGCDGAHARSRACFSIPFGTVDGLPARQIHYCSVNINADMTTEKSGMLWFILTRSGGKRNFIAYNRANNWVFVTAYDPTITAAEAFTEDYCRFLIDEVCVYSKLLMKRKLMRSCTISVHREADRLSDTGYHLVEYHTPGSGILPIEENSEWFHRR